MNLLANLIYAVSILLFLLTNIFHRLFHIRKYLSCFFIFFISIEIWLMGNQQPYLFVCLFLMGKLLLK